MSDFDLILKWDWLSAFKPPAKLSPAEWACANIKLPAETNADPGPLRLTSYQRGIVEAFTDPNTDIIALQLAAQTGKSITIDTCMLWVMANDPAPNLHVSPTGERSVDFFRDRLQPLIRNTPAVRDIVSDMSNSRIQFEGGAIHGASSYRPDQLAARSVRYVWLDEVDRFTPNCGTEGSPIDLAIKRTHAFASNKKIIIASTPTAKGNSRIAEWFDLGTRERFYVPCPECGTFEPLRFENLKWEPKRPQSARYVCEHCAHHLTNRERLEAVDLGDWRATNVSPAHRVRSFHATALVSRFATLEAIAAEFERADTPEKKRVFTNTVLADVFDYNTEAGNEPNDLRAKSEQITAPYSADIAHVTAGVDIQGNRAECLFMAHTETGQRYVLDHVIVHGDPTGPELWRDLGNVLDSTFPLQDRRVLPLSVTFVDAGYLSSNVSTFVSQQRQRQRRVFATIGRAGFDRPNVKEGQKLAGKLRFLVLGVDSIKLTVMRELGVGKIKTPAHLSSDWFQQLCAERLEAKVVRGFTKLEFVKDGNTRNEALDCCVYAYAAATLVKGRAKPLNEKAKETSVADLAAKLHATTNPTAGASTNGHAYRH